MKGQIFILVFMILQCQVQSADFDLFLFNVGTGARCLDGSKYGVYKSNGFNEGQRNIIINFWGGGLCEGRTHAQFYEDCYQRSKDELGSSKNWNQQTSFQSGFLNDQEQINPNFYNWNKFDFPYCDGSFHQGNVTKPILHKGRQLYIRGRQNVFTGLNYVIEQIDLTQIERVVITGGSTGGYATYTFINYIQELFHQINSNIQILGIPDSGFFVDYYNYKTHDRYYYETNKIFHEIVNKEVSPMLKDCLNQYPNEQDQCLFTENFVQYVKVPLLILNSQYDSSNLYETVGLECVDNDTLDECNQDELKYTQIFREYQNYLIQRELNKNSNFSAFLISCVTHCFDEKMDSLDWTIPENSGFTIYKAVEQFLKNPYQAVHSIDQVEWPLNTRCSNHYKQISNKILVS